MNDSELKNKAIAWLNEQNKICKTRPYSFKPKEVAEAIFGAYTALGRVAQEVVDELNRRGIEIRYRKVGNKRFFELF